MAKLISGRPNINNIVLDAHGKFQHVWYLFLIQIWEKLGGSEDRLDDASPTGMVSGFGGSAAPEGWLFCDGSAVSRTGFSDLFNVISVTYGVGDGSTTFNLPDGRGRTLVGAGAGPTLTPRARGDEFGEETHVLTAAELTEHTHSIVDPGHIHTVTDPGHAHANSTDNFVNDAVGAEYDNTNGDKGTTNANSGSSITGVTVDSAITGITADNAGSGDAFNVIQPSWVANWMIKT